MIGSWALNLLLASAALTQPVDDLERDDSLAASIAWRLQTANSAFCARVAPATGIQLEDTAAYADPALARSTYGLTGDIYVGALAQDGPGTRAGLTVNTTIAAIDGQQLSALPVPGRHDPFARLRQAQGLLDAEAAHDGAVTMTTADGREVRVTAAPACQFAVRIEDQGNYADATRDEVRLGRRHFDSAHGDPDLIAALIAHEMAHAVLDHQSLITASHRALPVIRRTEREADRLSVWLLANAGYPPESAIRFQQTIIAHFHGGLVFDPEHGGWRERVRFITAEIDALKAAPDFDWARRFRREVE